MKALISLFLLCIVLSRCGGSAGDRPTKETGDSTRQITKLTAAQLQQKIATLEAKTLNDRFTLNDSLARQLLRSYQVYYNFYPRDPMTPEMLYKGADLARGLGRFRQAITLLGYLYEGYPDFEQRDEVAFLIGFNYETGLHDTTAAIRAYEDVIALHPRSIWAEEARQSIAQLQMTGQQLLEFLKKKNQQPS